MRALQGDAIARRQCLIIKPYITGRDLHPGFAAVGLLIRHAIRSRKLCRIQIDIHAASHANGHGACVL